MSEHAQHAESAQDLLDATNLVDVVFYEYRAARKAADDETSKSTESSPSADTTISIMERHDSRRIEIRCAADVQTSEAVFRVDAAARFESPQDLTFSTDALTEFVQRVGLMAVYPYLREGVASLASKLRVSAPTLQLIRGDQVRIDRIAPDTPTMAEG